MPPQHSREAGGVSTRTSHSSALAGAGAGLVQLSRALVTLAECLVGVPVPMRQLTSVCNFSSRVLDALFCSLQAHGMYGAHRSKISIHTKEIDLKNGASPKNQRLHEIQVRTAKPSSVWCHMPRNSVPGKEGSVGGSQCRDPPSKQHQKCVPG